VRDAGGCRELVDATGAGFVYKTSEQLQQALSRLANEPGLREILARRAREGFLRLYTPQRHLERYLAHVDAIRHAKGLH
jgi:glycosyltransferase involved in cell wall biosynthesis